MNPVVNDRATHISLNFQVAYPNTPFFRSRGLAGKPHLGVDISPLTQFVNERFIIQAPVSGKLVFNRWHGPYGNLVAIRSKENNRDYLHILAHLAMYRKDLKEGDIVKKGEQIGIMGATGAIKLKNGVIFNTCTGKHLHYQVDVFLRDAAKGSGSHWWLDGIWKPINPVVFLS